MPLFHCIGNLGKDFLTKSTILHSTDNG